MSARSWVCGFALVLLSLPAFGLATKSVSEGVTPEQVAQLLSGPGATIFNVVVTGSESSLGSFTGGDVFGVPSGIILSSGSVGDAVGPNDATGKGAGMGTAGHPFLDKMVAPFTTNDAIVLEFDVIPQSPTLSIRYVFASEEYPEWVDSEYNDVFAFIVNENNIALTPGSKNAVTINTINENQNSALYVENTGDGTQFDGYTTPLLAVTEVTPGVSYHITIAVADTTDSALDTAVFIAQGGISAKPLAPTLIPSLSVVDLALGETFELAIPVYFADEENPPTFSASGVEDATVTFSPLYRNDAGQLHTDLKIVLGPNTPPGTHTLTLRSALDDTESFAVLLVVVDCRPPALLGAGQPVTQIVDRGKPATLTATPLGSGPFTYQWYNGYTGMTRNPVTTGGKSAQLTTGAVSEMSPYWVRVSNACGSYDSLTAFAIPK